MYTRTSYWQRRLKVHVAHPQSLRQSARQCDKPSTTQLSLPLVDASSRCAAVHISKDVAPILGDKTEAPCLVLSHVAF